MSREVLAPPLMRMDKNRSYRVNQVHEDFGGNPAARQQQQAGYMEQDLYAEDDGDDDELDACTIEELLPQNMFKLTVHIAPSLYGGLIGFKGTTKRRIETETQTDIYVPRNREGSQKVEDITIKGKTRSSVVAAYRKINLLIASLRKRMRPTHFLCVALASGEILQNYNEFKKQVLAAELPGIDEQLFQTDECIHLTLGTCVLLDDVDRTKAVELLQSCKTLLTNLSTPFNININGLEIMNDDPSAVRVLYARVDAPDLQEFANQAKLLFIKSGLGFPEFGRDTVKLHMTLMNTTYRKIVNETQPKANAATNFDAREILKRFGDFNFGTAQCNEVHLCVMREPGEARVFYKITGTLKF